MGERSMDRVRAVERYRAGESASSIASSMGYSARWVQKCVQRAVGDGERWYEDRSRRPLHPAGEYDEPIAAVVMSVRQQLEAEGAFCGAQVIRWELERKRVEPIPSVATIARMIRRAGLVRRRPGRYESKGVRYPGIDAKGPGYLHQSDFVGPCYLRGAGRFYTLNTVDIATGRSSTEPLIERGGQAVVDALWHTWKRLGKPRFEQVDNDPVFIGSHRHPRAMGQLIRLCLAEDVEPVFIPPAEPWRNGVIEKFNNFWRDRFLARHVFASVQELIAGSRRFEENHNARWRYTKLAGRTPNEALKAARTGPRPVHREPPKLPLQRPERGRYHLVRLIRSDRHIDIFGERFLLPRPSAHEYVTATVDVAQQTLSVFLDRALIEQFPYQLR